MTTAVHGKERTMRSTPLQPFHRDDLDPDLGQLVDDFLVELDRLLRLQPPKRKARQAKKAGTP